MTHDDEATRKAIAAASNRTWREENSEANAAYQRDYAAKHRERILENKRRRYQEETPEKRAERAAYVTEWAKKNREARLEHQRRYREKNRDSIREYTRKVVRDETGAITPKEKQHQARNRVQRVQNLEQLAGRPRPLLCEVCGRPPDVGKSLHYDHCHAKGHFRGWLCRSCNLILGHADDDPEILLKLSAYLTN